MYRWFEKLEEIKKYYNFPLDSGGILEIGRGILYSFSVCPYIMPPNLPVALITTFIGQEK